MFNKIVGVVLCGLTLSLPAFAGPAVNAATGKCLDSNTDGQVYALGCNGGAFQNWSFAAGDQGYEIRDGATGKCLDSNTDGQVYALGCNGGAFQRWALANQTSSGYEYRNAATGKCLDSGTDGKVYSGGCNGGAFQRWH